MSLKHKIKQHNIPTQLFANLTQVQNTLCSTVDLQDTTQFKLNVSQFIKGVKKSLSTLHETKKQQQQNHCQINHNNNSKNHSQLINYNNNNSKKHSKLCTKLDNKLLSTTNTNCIAYCVNPY